MKDAYKYLLEDDFTLRFASFLRIGGENGPKLISIEETARRHEFRERILNDGEILKIPVALYD